MAQPARARTGVSGGAKRGDGLRGSITKEEEERRRRIVEAAYLLADSIPGAVAACAEIDGPGPDGAKHRIRLSERTVKRYIAKSRALWDEEGEPKRQERKRRQRRRLLIRAMRAEQAGAYGPMMRAETLLAQIDGTLAPQKVEVTKERDRLAELSDEQFAKVREAAELLGEDDDEDDEP